LRKRWKTGGQKFLVGMTLSPPSFLPACLGFALKNLTSGGGTKKQGGGWVQISKPCFCNNNTIYKLFKEIKST
jgi:hypothetical protein